MKINAPQYPMTTSFEPQSPNNPKDCFRIVKPKIFSRIGLKQGEVLEDAIYWVYFNLSRTEKCLTGKELFTVMQDILETTYIPWVLARCTIIPV